MLYCFYNIVTNAHVVLRSKKGKTDVEIAKLIIHRSEYFTVKIVNRNNNYNDYDLKVWQF